MDWSQFEDQSKFLSVVEADLNQLDNFELISAKGLKDRYIFDFSRNIDVSKETIVVDPATPGTDYRYYFGWNNLTYYSNNYYTASVGNPGDCFIIQKNFSNKTNIQPIFLKFHL